MKISKKVLWVLGVIVFIVAFVFLYTMYSRQAGEQAQINASLSSTQTNLLKLASEKDSLEDELAQFEGRVTEAEALLEDAKAGFPDKVESIEYAEILFINLTEPLNLEITEFTALEPSQEKVLEVRDKEKDEVTYMVTYFAATMQGKAPETIFQKAEEFEEYVNGTVDDVLTLVSTIAISSDFSTTAVESVNISVPRIPIDEEIRDTVIGLLPEEKQEEIEGLPTEEELTEIINSLTEEETVEIIEKGFERTSATIELAIYSYKEGG